MDKTKKLEILNEVTRLYEKLKKVQPKNAEKYAFYYGKKTASQLNIKMPSELAGCSFALGWAATAADVMKERTKWTGFTSINNPKLAQKYNAEFRGSYFEAMQNRVVLDAYVTGNAYISIAPGDIKANEKDVLYMPESSMLVYGEQNTRTGLLDNAIKIVNKTDVAEKILYYDTEAVYKLKRLNGGSWSIEEDDINYHGLGRVPMVRIIRGQDNVYTEGRSVITTPLRALIFQAMDVLVGSSQAMHYFAYPLRIFLNTVASMFEQEAETSSGKADNGLKIFGEIRDAISIPYNSQNQTPVSAIQFSGNNPENILNLLDTYAKLASREMGVTPSYLGVESVNPMAEGGINADERKLTSRVNDDLPAFQRGFRQMMELGQLVRNNGTMDDGFDDITLTFKNPEYFTPGASADRALKIKQADVFTVEYPRWYYEELGMGAQEIEETLAFVRKNRQTELVTAIAAALPSGEVAVGVPEDTGA